jgi:hypothetical protein
MYFGDVRFHVDFLSSAICLGCCLKLPYCKPKARAQGIMNQWTILNFHMTIAQY